jgi:hypothetical protein
VQRLRAVLDHIEQTPETWDQATWARYGPDCGTAYCFAGHASVLAGDPPDFSEATRWNALSVRYVERTISGEFIEDVARRWLDLCRDDASALFSPVNSLDDLRELVASYDER